MKKFKKIFAVLLTLAMVLGMSMTTFAAPAKVTDQYANKINVANLAQDVSTEVRVFNIIYLERDDTGNEKWVVVDWAKRYVQEDSATGKFVITDKAGLKKAVDAKTQTEADAFKTTKETSCECTNLPIGAYVVWANDTAGTYGLMVANTYDKDETYMASKAADVVAKVEGYVVGKKASDKFVHRGQNVKFTVTTRFPAKEKESADGTKITLNEFKNTDEPSGLLITGMPTVTIGGTPVTITSSMVTNTVAGGMTTSYEVDLSSFIDSSQAGQTVTVTYNATVINDDKYNNNADAESNTVKYTPTRVDGFEGNITLTKVNKEKETLAGAEFQVYKADEEESKADALAKTPLYFVKTDDGVYKQALSKDETGATQTIVTGTAGTVKVTGLDEGTYYFKETKAPDGYALVNDPVSATIDDGNSDREVSIGANGKFTFVNTKLAELPGTGGIGTTIFTIGGCLIMIIAAALFFANRRKAK